MPPETEVTEPLPVPAPISERTCVPVLYCTTPEPLMHKNLSGSPVAFKTVPMVKKVPRVRFVPIVPEEDVVKVVPLRSPSTKIPCVRTQS